MEELRVSQIEVSALLTSMADVQDWQREPAEWSFRFIAADLVTVERECHFYRIVRIASGERPHFECYSRSDLNLDCHDLRDSLSEWRDARDSLLHFVESLPLEKLEVAGVQADIGDITILDILQLLLDQDRGNARHIRQLIEDYYEELLHPAY